MFRVLCESVSFLILTPIDSLSARAQNKDLSSTPWPFFYIIDFLNALLFLTSELTLSKGALRHPLAEAVERDFPFGKRYLAMPRSFRLRPCRRGACKLPWNGCP